MDCADGTLDASCYSPPRDRPLAVDANRADRPGGRGAVPPGAQVSPPPLININWDEFRFLSRIYELDRGELGSAFQTFHVELFRWLLGTPGNEADQVIAGRTFAFALRPASSYRSS
jgi:hypothetical protein